MKQHALAFLSIILVAWLPGCKKSQDKVVSEMEYLRKENLELENALKIAGHQSTEKEKTVVTSVDESVRALLSPNKSQQQRELVECIFGAEAEEYFSEDKEFLAVTSRIRNGIGRSDETKPPTRPLAIYAAAFLLVPNDAGIENNGDAYSYLLKNLLNITPTQFDTPADRYAELITKIPELLADPKYSTSWKAQRTIAVKITVPSTTRAMIEQKIKSNNARLIDLASTLATHS
jgi:hypothetical protein